MSSGDQPPFEIEILRNDRAALTLSRADATRLCVAALQAAAIAGGHVCIELVTPERIRAVNAERRGKDAVTDVLSFPIDGADAAGHGAAAELGDILICPEHTADVREAIVHGALHLAGMDHETDDGEMLALQAQVLDAAPTATRSGFIALAGRPNAGKSTLVNRLVGSKVAIVSNKPQTTRRAIRGVVTEPGAWQLVLVDLPGVQRPRDQLTERMQRRVEHEWDDADGALLILNGDQGIGPGDRFIAAALREAGVPVVVAVNKIDRLSHQRTVEVLHDAAQLGPDWEVFPISALRGQGVEALRDHLVSLLGEGPFYFDPADRSDQPRHVELAELIREQVLVRTRQEVPHAVEAIVDEVERTPSGLVRIVAHLWVETNSQKGVLVGARGQMIRAIGSAARAELERHLDARVHLDLSVRVRRRWRADDALLDRLGIE